MDEQGVGLDEFRACLVDLASANTVTLAPLPTLAWLRRATKDLPKGSTVTILDVGYGYGDMLRRIHRWCTRRGLVPDLLGVDLNPWSSRIAREATPAAMDIEYRTGDVFAFKPDRPIDYVVSSLFTHHLPDEALVGFVSFMERTGRRGWFINDLHRHAIPYYGFFLMARLARWHRFVQHDGPVSIARAFRRDDWARIISHAGLGPDAVEIRWHVPFRLCVGRTR